MRVSHGKGLKFEVLLEVVIDGDISTGKTSFLLRYFELVNPFPELHGRNVDGSDFLILYKEIRVKLQLWNAKVTCLSSRFFLLAGKLREASASPPFFAHSFFCVYAPIKHMIRSRSIYGRANVILLIYDITNANSLTALERKFQSVKEYAKPNCKVVIIGNKKDLVDKDEKKREVSKEYAKNFITSLCEGEREVVKLSNVFFGGEISCENGEGVEETIIAAMNAYFGKFPVCRICKGPMYMLPVEKKKF